MKYVVYPLKQDPITLDFGPGSAVLCLDRPARSGRTEIINVLCELIGGIRASEDSRPDRRRPWTTSASVRAYTDAGGLDFHALRYENGREMEAVDGDLLDASLCVLGYSSFDQCGWYHAGQYLSVSGAHIGGWDGLCQALGMLASIEDGSFRDVINECLEAAGLPVVVGASCLRHEVYSAEFRRSTEKNYLSQHLLTRTERAGILQVCSQVVPWLLHARYCTSRGVPAMETCYCLIDDLASGVNLGASHAVMQRRFPGNRFMTVAFV